MDTRSGLYLGYEKKETGAPLILTREPVQWKIEPVKRGFQIGLEGSDLVFGALPRHIHPPEVGLTKQDKEESQAWRLQPLELDPTPYAPEGDFMLMHANFRFIGIIGREPSSLVYLLDRPSEFTIWTVRNEGPRDLVSIQNRETGLYLSYSSDKVDEPLTITRHKSMFRMLTIQNSIVQIITAHDDISARAVSELNRGNPPLAGLAVIHKNPNQIWRLRPVAGLDDSPRQYRLPFRRLRFW
ncbi:hypothetical protein DFQ26_001142 [Actinomortierella ambigua]|nr:hypothetical protein DFQ26_001142 [Actinomortierella ambigua]